MLDNVTTIEELRQIAHRRVPTMFYDYMESGSWTEKTFRANCDDFQKISFRQRIAVDMSNRTTRTTMLGEPVAMPAAIAPTGLTGMQHADGEILAARAAAKFGILTKHWSKWFDAISSEEQWELHYSDMTFEKHDMPTEDGGRPEQTFQSDKGVSRFK